MLYRAEANQHDHYLRHRVKQTWLRHKTQNTRARGNQCEVCMLHRLLKGVAVEWNSIWQP